MRSCTFFGHADTSDSIRSALREKIVELIERENVTIFFVGNHGNFDRLAAHILKELQPQYPQIQYTVVLAYLPKERNDNTPTLYPEGIETVPKRFAILWRNRWMLERSDFVVTHVRSPVGGAAKFKTLAEKQNKKVINLI